MPECQHYSLILANKIGEFRDPQIKLYLCLACGTPQLVYPVGLFKNNNTAKKQLLSMAKEIQLPTLNRKQKRALQSISS